MAALPIIGPLVIACRASEDVPQPSRSVETLAILHGAPLPQQGTGMSAPCTSFTDDSHTVVIPTPRDVSEDSHGSPLDRRQDFLEAEPARLRATRMSDSSTEHDVQLARASDLASRPQDFGTLVQMEDRDTLQPLLEGYAELHPRQI